MGDRNRCLKPGYPRDVFIASPPCGTQPMNPDALEDCLQAAAEQSSAWALIKETDQQAWVLVLSDESLVDLACDESGEHLLLRAELGLVPDVAQRSAINELVLRCTGVIPMPAICLGPDHRYETLTRWPIDLSDARGLATLFEDITEQTRIWRDVVAKPMTHKAAQPAMTAPEATPAYGVFA